MSDVIKGMTYGTVTCGGPAAGVTIALYKNGVLMGTAATDSLGRYAIFLAAGLYTAYIVGPPNVPLAKVPPPPITACPMPFVVPAGIAQINLICCEAAAAKKKAAPKKKAAAKKAPAKKK